MTGLVCAALAALLLAGCGPGPSAVLPAVSGPARHSPDSLHRAALVVDLHTDALYFHARGLKDITRRSDSLQVDIPRLQTGGVDAQVFAIWP
ncbi:hypothetical protein FJY71_07705, partial [candidate division WOR-3 bacterium]|nr:hypothetical protein [candidate division WOR-3 bacterium]